MTEDDRLEQFLRSAFPATASRGPSRDLWPLVASRILSPARPTWFDIGLAAAIALLLLMFPEWILLLAYHL